MPRGPPYTTVLPMGATGVMGRRVYADAFHDPSCNIDLMCEASVSSFVVVVVVASMVNFQWSQPAAHGRHCTGGEMLTGYRLEERTVTGYSVCVVM